MKNGQHPELNTIDAINKMCDDFPYAATMLCYVIIERQLKRYILENRNGYLASEKVFVHILRKKIVISDYSEKMDTQFCEEVLIKMTLSEIEKLLKIKDEQKVSKDRNDVMHSNLYFISDKNVIDEHRHEKHKQYFKKARSHLVEILNMYSGNCNSLAVQPDGLLSFKE